MRRRALLVAVAAAVALSAVRETARAAAADLHVMQPTAPATPPQATTAAVYLMVHNAGAVGDRLIGASTPVAAKVEMHSVTFKGGVAQMRLVDGIDVAPGGMIEFTSGTRHLMLSGIRQALKAGERFELTLKFANAGEIRVTVPVSPLGSTRMADMPGMRH